MECKQKRPSFKMVFLNKQLNNNLKPKTTKAGDYFF